MKGITRRLFGGMVMATGIMGGRALAYNDKATGGVAPRGIMQTERLIPPPATISPEAQEALSHEPVRITNMPAVHDKEGWRANIAEVNELVKQQFGMIAKRFPAQIITHARPNNPVYEVIPETIRPEHDKHAILFVHGGSYTYCSGMVGAWMSQQMAHLSQIRAFCVDYRMPPDHPYPAAMDDCVDAYNWLLERYKPENLAVAGGSAGGGLLGSLMHKVRDLGLPLPAACVLQAPEADLTEAGDSFETTLYQGTRPSLSASIAAYADGHNLHDPYLSPVYGDFTKGYPPTIITIGTRDIFLSNAARLHRSMIHAGVEAELHLWEAMPHGGFGGLTKEDADMQKQQAAFIRKKLQLAALG